MKSRSYYRVGLVLLFGILICLSVQLWMPMSFQWYGAALHSRWKENTQLHENSDGTYRLRVKGLDRGSSLSRDVPKLTAPNYFENVCIHAGDVMHPFRDGFVARLNIYAGSSSNGNRQHNNRSLLYEINWRTDIHTNFWLLHVHAQQVPPDWPVLPAIAYFPWYWRCSDNIWLLWCHTAPAIYQQMKWSRANIAGLESASLPSYVIAPIYSTYFRTHFAHALTDMGISEVKIFRDVWQKGPVCFKYGVFGNHHDVAANVTAPDDMGQVLQAKWNLTSPCKAYYVLLLDRIKSRHILQAEEIIDHLQKKGHNVKLDYFDNKSLKEQMDAVRCASAFIGVQGAGLSWYQFLPPKATFIELHWYGWISRYKLRAKESRPDISAHAIECKPVTPASVWQHYAQLWFNHRGPIDDVMKQRLREKSDRVQDIKGTIWKDSNCECNIDEITRLLPAKTS